MSSATTTIKLQQTTILKNTENANTATQHYYMDKLFSVIQCCISQSSNVAQIKIFAKL